jgi:hypothetical protein
VIGCCTHHRPGVRHVRGLVPLDLTIQLMENGTAAKSGALQLTSNQMPLNVSIWNSDSVYAMVRKTEAGEMHMSITVVAAARLLFMTRQLTLQCKCLLPCLLHMRQASTSETRLTCRAKRKK